MDLCCLTVDTSSSFLDEAVITFVVLLSASNTKRKKEKERKKEKKYAIARSMTPNSGKEVWVIRSSIPVSVPS